MSNKSNGADATKRAGNLPRASRVVEAGKEDVGAAVRLAAQQNSVDGEGINVIPLSLEQEIATAKARARNATGALSSDVGSRK